MGRGRIEKKRFLRESWSFFKFSGASVATLGVGFTVPNNSAKIPQIHNHPQRRGMPPVDKSTYEGSATEKSYEIPGRKYTTLLVESPAPQRWSLLAKSESAPHGNQYTTIRPPFNFLSSPAVKCFFLTQRARTDSFMSIDCLQGAGRCPPRAVHTCHFLLVLTQKFTVLWSDKMQGGKLSRSETMEAQVVDAMHLSDCRHTEQVDGYFICSCRIVSCRTIRPVRLCEFPPDRLFFVTPASITDLHGAEVRVNKARQRIVVALLLRVGESDRRCGARTKLASVSLQQLMNSGVDGLIFCFYSPTA